MEKGSRKVRKQERKEYKGGCQVRGAYKLFFSWELIERNWQGKAMRKDRFLHIVRWIPCESENGHKWLVKI